MRLLRDINTKVADTILAWSKFQMKGWYKWPRMRNETLNLRKQWNNGPFLFLIFIDDIVKARNINKGSMLMRQISRSLQMMLIYAIKSCSMISSQQLTFWFDPFQTPFLGLQDTL